MWLLAGTVFYAVHDEFGWSVGFYQSVNIGWSIGWRLPLTPSVYNSFYSKLFSLFHNTIGVMFSGIAVIYIAAELSASKDSWLTKVVKQDALEDAAATEGWLDDVKAFITLYFHKSKVILLLILFAWMGILASYFMISNYTWGHAFKLTFATLTGGGYYTIPDNSDKWKFVLCAIYAAFGIPLLIISMGELSSAYCVVVSFRFTYTLN